MRQQLLALVHEGMEVCDAVIAMAVLELYDCVMKEMLTKTQGPCLAPS